MCKVSAGFYYLANSRWVWCNATRRDILDKGLPLPGPHCDMGSLSTKDIRNRAIHAAKFHDDWHSSKPTPYRAIEFRLRHASSPDSVESNLSQVPSVDQIFFLPRQNGQYIVILAGGVLSCWEVPLEGSTAYLVAEHREASAIKEIVVNDDPTHKAVLACRTENERE